MNRHLMHMKMSTLNTEYFFSYPKNNSAPPTPTVQNPTDPIIKHILQLSENPKEEKAIGITEERENFTTIEAHQITPKTGTIRKLTKPIQEPLPGAGKSRLRSHR
ncbi:hypothetical protein JTB14_006969 [Gonioctena quinquepunctata]|nr:hypothetical protein JTB14_006969 [Gonioctena quinquepunctata]